MTKQLDGADRKKSSFDTLLPGISEQDVGKHIVTESLSGRVAKTNKSGTPFRTAKE